MNNFGCLVRVLVSVEKLCFLATGYMVGKATEQQGEFAKDGVIMKFNEVVQNYCEDTGRWK